MTQDICASADLRAGAMMQATVGSRTIAVARSHGGALYAFSARCLHQGAPLSRGRVLAGVDGERPGEYRLADGREVVKCPWHGYEYDLASGVALFDRRRRLRTFPAYEHQGRVLVDIQVPEAACRI